LWAFLWARERGLAVARVVYALAGGFFLAFDLLDLLVALDLLDLLDLLVALFGASRSMAL